MRYQGIVISFALALGMSHTARAMEPYKYGKQFNSVRELREEIERTRGRAQTHRLRACGCLGAAASMATGIYEARNNRTINRWFDQHVEERVARDCCCAIFTSIAVLLGYGVVTLMGETDFNAASTTIADACPCCVEKILSDPQAHDQLSKDMRGGIDRALFGGEKTAACHGNFCRIHANKKEQ